MGIFKAYDIRGLFPSEIDEDICYRVGFHLAQMLEAKRLVVGQDMRVHSPGLADAVSRGMRDAGCDVIRLGLASTPMTYHAIATLECDGGLCVTASHNPGEYNGMKLCRAGAKPISAANGILDIEKLAAGRPPFLLASSVSKSTWISWRTTLITLLLLGASTNRSRWRLMSRMAWPEMRFQAC